MSDQPVKGRRAAERRRQRNSDDDAEAPQESTTPGSVAPAEGRARGNTAITSMTNVGAAAQNLMRSDPAEQTRVHAVQEGPVLPAGRLICLDGRDVGKSFDLTHDVMVVGRGNDVHIKLGDPAISRVHFEVRWELATGAFAFVPVVKDPPPLLNGEEAAGSARELADGDVIEVGETTLRFVRVEGAPPTLREAPKTEAPPPVREPTIIDRTRLVLLRASTSAAIARRMLAAGLVLLVLAGVGAVAGWRWWQQVSRQNALNDANGSYQVLLRTARQHRESRKWNDLTDAARALTALAPERDDGARLEEEARSEKLAERNLNLGRMNLANGNWDAARSALRLIPDTSTYRAERDGVLEKVNEVGRGGSLANIRRLLAEGRFKEAMEAADQHLLIYPDDAEVSSLRAQAVKTQAAREAAGSSAWQSRRNRALQALDAGDFTQAIAFAEDGMDTPDRALAAAFLERLRALQKEWKTGRDQVRAKDPRAMGSLQRAKQLNAELAGRNSLTADIARNLADAYYLGGVGALGGGKECEARAFFEKADAERGGDPKVTDKLSRLTARGRELLGKAEAARAGGNMANAKRLARDAACRLKRGDEDHQRAEKLAAGKG